jgi:protocadherin-16/23
VDTAANSTGVVSYSLRDTSDYFAINATTGIVYLLQDLLPGNGSSDTGTGRRKRDLEDLTVSSKVTLIVVASSGSPNPRTTEIPVTINVDRTCPGCSIEPQTTPHSAIPNNGGGLLSGTPLALVIAFVAIAVIFVIAFTIIFMRHKAQKKLASSPSSRYGESTESIDVLPPPHSVYGPSGLVNGHHVTFGSVHGNTTTASDPSRSASSGRGSAGDNDDVDDEIRMINATPAQFAQPLVLVPDSGIPHDDDVASENASIMGSVRNHQEYLARLGIHPSTTGHGRINGNVHGAGARRTGQQPTGVTAAISVESMHQFSEEGGGEDYGVSSGGGAGPAMSVSGIGMGTVDGEDIDFDGASIAGSSSGAGAGEVMGVGSCTAMTGSLASIVNSEEEFGGSYGWDYLLNWTPQYHPLAQVFAEIARLKDDVVKPKLAPTLIVPQTPNMRAAGGANQNRGTTAMPPPIITDAPPRAIHPSKASPEDHSSFGVLNQLQQQQLAMGQQTPQSNRTSMLTNVSLPKSPISYESTCTSPMMSPSFSPTLSPLANYSPSFSPIVSARGIGSVSSGHASPSTRFDQQLPVDRPELVMNGQQRQVQETYGVPPSSMYEISQTPMLQHTAVPVPYQTSRQMSTNHVPPSNHMMGGYLVPPAGLNRLANGSARSAGSSTGSDRQSNGNTRHDRQSSKTRSRQDPLTNGNAHGQRRGQTMDQLGSNGVHGYNNNDYTHVPNGHPPYSPHTANSRRYVDESSRDIQI